jgi:hypothetical protein
MFMQKFTCRTTVPRILVTMILLRSLIATGFMLAVSDGSLELITCNGPVSFVSVASDSKHEHHNSSEHSEKSQLHISPSCSDWSTSSLLVGIPVFELPVLELAPEKTIRSNIVFIDESLNSINQIRAPPSVV